MKTYSVEITLSAKNDLYDLWSYIAENDHVANANLLIEKLEELCINLFHLPERGHIVPEMKRLDINKFREIHYKSYRIIYEIDEEEVFIVSVIDGRRNLETLLRQKLLTS